MKAIIFYELALHFNPQCAEACNNLGVIYKDRDNLEKAVECYQVIFMNISFDLGCFSISHFSVFFARFGYYITINSDIYIIYELVIFQTALMIKPTFSQSLNNLGVIYTVQVNLLILLFHSYYFCEVDAYGEKFLVFYRGKWIWRLT